ncbi:MAG: hypothetical protein M3Z33_00790 [Actinomycetota bacterium]|nr:hypothetical protein [Actinomycetota bacterium]
MPTFCRHNRFVENCPICGAPEPTSTRRQGVATATRPTTRAGGVRIRQAARTSDDGYRSGLAPGIKLQDDATRLAEEIAFAVARLNLLASTPPGLYAEVASMPDAEEALWLAFLIAYVGPLEGEDPFAAIRSVRTPWDGGELPSLDGVASGPRSAYDRAQGARTLAAYRAWAQRAGSQAAAYAGEAHWTPERRFERTFERLALPGLHRAARFDLLVSLGRLGRIDAHAASLHLGDDHTTIAAKRVFGIGDPLLIDRRARELVDACQVPLGALDLALYNWSRQPGEQRATLGAADADPDESVRERSLAALEA